MPEQNKKIFSGLYIGGQYDDSFETYFSIDLEGGGIYSIFDDYEKYLVSESLEKFIQVFSAYGYKELQKVEDLEFYEVCQYLGVDCENRFFQSIRQVGRPPSGELDSPIRR